MKNIVYFVGDRTLVNLHYIKALSFQNNFIELKFNFRNLFKTTQLKHTDKYIQEIWEPITSAVSAKGDQMNLLCNVCPFSPIVLFWLFCLSEQLWCTSCTVLLPQLSLCWLFCIVSTVLFRNNLQKTRNIEGIF